MRVELQPAFVIHRRAYRNTSWLLEVFTRDHGIVALVAKGARRAGSSLRHSLEPFSELRISFSGRTELMTLISAENSCYSVPLVGDKLFVGMYLNELLKRLLHRSDPHETLFLAYKKILNDLRGGNNAIEPALRCFELCLLREIGYGLILDHDVETGKKIEADNNYIYDVERGPLLSSILDRKKSINISGSSLIALDKEDFSNSLLMNEIKILLRAVLNYHLGDKPLKSRELFSGGKK